MRPHQLPTPERRYVGRLPVPALLLLTSLLSAAAGCDQDRPPPTLTDSGPGGPPGVGPDGGLAPVFLHPTVGQPSFVVPAASSGPPSEDWTSPPVCPLATDDAHCEACWFHTDNGPVSLDRNESGDHFGDAVAIADFNGDGYPDIAVGAPYEDTSETDAGMVYVYLGSANGFQPKHALDDADMEDGAASALFGASVHAADLDADGRADLLIGYGGDVVDAPFGWYRGTESGLVFADSWHLSEIDPGMATQDDARFGTTCATLDSDDDGDIDLVAVSAPYLSGGGVVYALTNSAGTLALSYSIAVSQVSFGAALEFSAGRLLIGRPAVGSVLGYVGASVTLSAGTGVLGIGTRLRAIEFDGDGDVGEFAAASISGPVKVFRDGAPFASAIATLSAPVSDPSMGQTWLVDAADLNTDGDPDFVVAYSDGTSTHQLFVLEGDGTGTRACWEDDAMVPCWYELDPGATGAMLGEAGSLADVDGDGHVDLLVSAPAGSDGGRVYSYTGAEPTDWDETLEPTQTITQETALPMGCEYCYVFQAPDGTVCDDMGDFICVLDECVERGCGDGYREPGPTPTRESCDDANIDDEDACTAMCVTQPLVISTDAFTVSSPSQRPPAVAEDDSESLLFVYVFDASATDTPAPPELRAQRTLRTGEFVGEPIVLATLDVGWDPQASVAGTSEGWAVVWRDPILDGADAGIAIRRVHADGTLSSVRQVNQSAPGSQYEPRVASLPIGFVVAWTDAGGVDGPLGRTIVKARRLDDRLAPKEDEWAVSSPLTTSSQPLVVSHGERWLLAYTEETVSGSRILAQRFGADSDTTATEITDDGHSAAAAFVEDTFVVAWVRRGDDYLGDIAARTFDDNGEPDLGAVVDITLRDPLDPPHAELAPSIAALSGGEYLVAYEDGGHRRGLAYAHVGMSTLASEHDDLDDHLVDALQGDVTLLRTGRGVWFAWSDARLGDPDAYRSFIAYLLPES